MSVDQIENLVARYDLKNICFLCDTRIYKFEFLAAVETSWDYFDSALWYLFYSSSYFTVNVSQTFLAIPVKM